ncbi:hypothetical protein WJR50_07925 [Catalinimonas sp. 4WD22]|uniref:hypothetical protein n=1 Tax=Catalinimonas locisalis TaxID=3133978 RepID=UPI0031012C2C
MTRETNFYKSFTTKLIAIGIIALLSCWGRHEEIPSVQKTTGEGYAYVTHPKKHVQQITPQLSDQNHK